MQRQSDRREGKPTNNKLTQSGGLPPKREMKINRWVVTAAIMAACGTGAEARADETSDTIKALREQIEQLDQKVRVLERKGELERETTVEKSAATPRLTID